MESSDEIINLNLKRAQETDNIMVLNGSIAAASYMQNVMTETQARLFVALCGRLERWKKYYREGA